MTSFQQEIFSMHDELKVRVVENGFAVVFDHPALTKDRVWVFSTADDAAALVSAWGDTHHPVDNVILDDDEDDPEPSAASDCTDRNAKRTYLFAVLVSGKSFVFDELMTPSKRAEMLTEIKSISDGQLQIFEPANEPSQTVRAIHGFRAAFAYLLAKYPGLIHWNDAARIAF